jgi:hypothetical protein
VITGRNSYMHMERGILILDVVPLLYIQYTTVK